ncbi:hypothetical protein [Candidatus Frankia alpina]|uniref:hypothetical protein n=1 Tax=Candidatus Frankia alpina TaxID=2699483 RepID=UPI0013D37FE9|nr:hypothetical protein [Candidatus Frankia alpina]
MTKDRDHNTVPGKWWITEKNGQVRRGGFRAALRAERKGKPVTPVPTTRQKRAERAARDADIGIN